MNRLYLLSITIIAASGLRAVDLGIRMGQGGYLDDRASDGKLGGGQICLDLRFSNIPLALSFSEEYYTKSSDPVHPYEIESLIMVEAFYVYPISDRISVSWRS
ncbi:hypothetical protein JXA40_02305 [bacterium]|nr:hypothetical protein [candidate division CSSED10-310 bacterium]